MKYSRHFARLIGIFVFFSMLLLILIWRMFDLTVLHRQFLEGQGNARSLRIIDIPAHRGMITDRNGTALAVSTPVKSVWINPKEFRPDKAQFMQLAEYLKLKPVELSRKIVYAKNKEFLYLQRQIPPMLAKKIKSLDIEGLYFQEEFKRFYPDSESISQLIGFTNIDDLGLEGIELAYQDWLMGVVGKKRVIKDRLGRIIDERGIIREPRPGRDLVLSIDRRLQYLAYSELNKTVEEFAASSGTVVVLDAKTGEILTIANVPSFNPNAREHYDKTTYRNMALTDTFEPGSVIKPFSIASALETGLFTPKSIINANPTSFITVQGHPVRDIHNYGILDVTGVLLHSSNVGVTKMVLSSPPEQLINLLQHCGFGQRTGSAYPGEAEGSIVKVKDANPFVLATLGFGYGMSATAVQLAQANMIFANQGELKPITLLYNDKASTAIQVISPKTASQVLHMMEAVVIEGTGKEAQVPGYRIAGKTGTAWVAGKKGYADKKYTASFIGIAPVSNPKFIVAVIIHEPSRKGYYATAVAAPLFSKVMAGALRLFNIPTDSMV